jgi:Tfp pilus assembly protein PilX
MPTLENNNQKGVSLYLAFMVLTIMTGIGLGLATISVNQIKGLREMGYSVMAFYAADAGIEKVLVDRQTPVLSPVDYYNDSLANGASFQITIIPAGEDCPAQFYCIKSVGSYKGINRAIGIEY